MDYSLRELECFIAAAEELSFTRAAQRLHLAQPPLSRHIRALEEKIGAPLFTRAARTVALTPAGACFYEESRTILPQLTRAAEAARRTASGETARLRLGFVSAVLGPELVDVLRTFRERFPAVQLVVEDQPPAEQLRALQRGALDLGFVGLRPEEKTTGVQFTPWLKERVKCFVPPGHALAGRAEIDVRELAQEPFAMVSGEAAPAFAAYVRALCGKAGFRPRVVFEAERAQAVAVMVAAGGGVALLPESLARVVGGGAVTVTGLRRDPAITHMFARRQGRADAVVTSFIGCLPGKRKP